MDISVLASVGSFVVSERVLKPKASVLVILGCVLAYDLTTKTHDISSLRVYRGPGLLAFSLMMVAYSLRTWRRNGVACDELLFLPGTRHGESTTPSIAAESGGGIGSHHNQSTHSTAAIPIRTPTIQLEGDVAAGGGRTSNTASTTTTNSVTCNTNEMHSIQQSESFRLHRSGNSNTAEPRLVHSLSQRSRARSLSHDSSLSSINEFVNTWEDDDDDDPTSTVQNDDDEYMNQNDEENLMIPLTSANTDRRTDEQCLQSSQSTTTTLNNNNNSSGTPEHRSTPTSSSNIGAQPQHDNHHSSSRVERFRENHPNVTRFGSIFFFRSSTSSTHNATYAPSGPSVVGAAIDLSMPVLFNFHLFIEAWNNLGDSDTETPAKILPLIFLSVLIVRTFFPPGRRGRFWSTMKFTAMTPYFHSRFRDCYIGDILTSLVRPLQDIIFALAYYVTVIWGSVTATNDLTESGRILESSWILHNFVLPTIALLPLWWKFLQTLREAYDTGKRWPYLGNAFKYLSAAIVILYGMTHPENRRSVWWIVAFGLTLLYQIFWDTVMDWDLFIVAPKENEGLDLSESAIWFNRPISSSVRPNSYWLLSIHRFLLPLHEYIRLCISKFPSYKQIQIRPRRLYKSELFYWRIFIYNTIFRFCWMLSFIPAYHLSGIGHHDVITTFSSDTNSYVGVLLPIAEILRRTLWGFLYLEIQTIKMTDGEPCHQLYTHIQGADSTSSVSDAIELSSMPPDSKHSGHRHYYLPAWLGMQQQIQHDSSLTTSTTSTSTSGTTSPTTMILSSWFQDCDISRNSNKFFIVELAMWVVAFIGCGVWATT